MSNRVLALYTDDEIRAKARHLRDQIDAGANQIANGLGANAGYISVAQALRLIEGHMDELDRRSGRTPPRRWNYTLINPSSGYGFDYRRRDPFRF